MVGMRSLRHVHGEVHRLTGTASGAELRAYESTADELTPGGILSLLLGKYPEALEIVNGRWPSTRTIRAT